MANPIAFLLVHLYVQLMVCPAHIAYAMLTGQANPYALTRHVCDVLHVQFLRTKKSCKLDPNAMYLCNHRSWADFFIDQTICGGSSYVARMMVWLGTPISSLYAWVAHSTWFFNRKSGIDRSKFFQFIDGEWLLRPGKGLIAYPEGTRNSKMEPLKLKTGLIQYAYEYKRPVQVVITTNKEHVVNEKRLKVTRGKIIVTAISEVTNPVDYPDMESFTAHVRELFLKTWNEVYSAEHEEAVVYDPPYGIPKPMMEPAALPLRIWLIRLLLFCYIAYQYYK